MTTPTPTRRRAPGEAFVDVLEALVFGLVPACLALALAYCVLPRW